jgi:hypothetical protein
MNYCVIKRKYPLLFVGESVTWFCKLVRLSVGVFVKATQFVVVKSKFCCKIKFVEGTSQEKVMLLL